MPIWQLLLGLGVAAWLLIVVIRDRKNLRRQLKQNITDNVERTSTEDGKR